jgi:hypothetical protein
MICKHITFCCQYSNICTCDGHLQSTGSYCGASLILELSVPTVDTLVSVDLKAHRNRDTPKVISQNAKKYNVNGANFHQVTGNSRDKDIIARVFDIFPKKNVDFFFIDGDHVDCRPDFYRYHSLVRPGGIIMFDDYIDMRIKHAVKSIFKNNTIRKCYHTLGTPVNVAQATSFGSKELPSEFSNEFIVQKKFNCLM